MRETQRVGDRRKNNKYGYSVRVGTRRHTAHRHTAHTYIHERARILLPLSPHRPPPRSHVTSCAWFCMCPPPLSRRHASSPTRCSAAANIIHICMLIRAAHVHRYGSADHAAATRPRPHPAVTWFGPSHRSVNAWGPSRSHGNHQRRQLSLSLSPLMEIASLPRRARLSPSVRHGG